MVFTDEGDGENQFVNAPDRVPRFSGGLTFTHAQLTAALGNSLADLYREVVLEPVPEPLKALLDELEGTYRSMAENNGRPKPLAASWSAEPTFLRMARDRQPT